MKKFKVEGHKMNIKLNYRAKEAEFEPIKYGGMGYCDSLTATKDVDDLELETIVETAKNMLSSFGIPLYDWRGIKMSFTVNSLEPEPEKIFKRRDDKDPFEEYFPMKEYPWYPSLEIIAERI